MKKIVMAVLLGSALFAGMANAGSYSNAVKIQETCAKVYQYNLGGSAWKAKQSGMSYERVLELTGAAEDEVQLKILQAVWNSNVAHDQNSANSIGWGVCMDHFRGYM